MITKQDIESAYTTLLESADISKELLSFMKDSSLEKLSRIENSKIGLLNNELETSNKWHSKYYSIIIVEKNEHIDILFDLLVEQDDYWEDFKCVIRSLDEINQEIKTYSDLDVYIRYSGKTDIYDFVELREKASKLGVEFFVYQNKEY